MMYYSQNITSVRTNDISFISEIIKGCEFLEKSETWQGAEDYHITTLADLQSLDSFILRVTDIGVVDVWTTEHFTIAKGRCDFGFNIYIEYQKSLNKGLKDLSS